MTAIAPLEWGHNSRLVSFEVARTIKGKADRVISLWTGSGGSDCGIDFRPARTYIVLARYLIADRCGGSE
jgi:hypothetical protein